MDDDDLRRGRPTCHVRFGEAMAVLAGDALLNLAYETIAAAPWSSATTCRDVLSTVAEAGSHRQLIGGQVLDLESEGDEPTDERLAAIHSAKTAALIRAAIVGGAQAAGASLGVQARLAEVARHLGMAFQITDDVLDVVGKAAELGKSPGKDAAIHKMTYPALHGVETSRRLAQEHAAAAVTALEEFAESDRLRALCAFFVERIR
jgi:geranylgeranyl diphosphate synthase type II